MTEQTANHLAEATRGSDGELAARHGYSGRSMYGSTTSGIVADSLGDLLAGVALVANQLRDDSDLENFANELRSVRQDNMGRSTIYY